MRMKVGEWISSWMCREVGIQFNNRQANNEISKRTDTAESRVNFKLVLAEPLEGRLDSHVQKFLDEHEGPGVQHIGLTTDDIEGTVKVLADRGATFRKPPPTYYKMVNY